ncbi:MAG: hypothetical protein RLZ55_907, partial [Actinomycetota bacterium]|jgi:Tfp pilus assembly protein PilF
MSDHLARARLLLQQSRPAEAEREAGLAVALAPDQPDAHLLLALSRIDQDKQAGALEAARTAVGLMPAASPGHYVHALILHRSARPQEALAAVQESIRLDPDDTDSFALQAAIHLQCGNAKEALGAADQALRLHPENTAAANCRAMALVRLGRKAEAMVTVDHALARDPENALSHANQGWNCLHRNDPRQSQEHFREALRLDPELDYAREGMLEALKARNFVYRAMLIYFLRMSRLSETYQWIVIAGTFFGSRILGQLALKHPEHRLLWWLILGIFYGFVYLTWTAQPMFNLFLRLDRFGRHVLSREQRIASNGFAPFFLAAAAATGWFLVADSDLSFFAMFMLAALSICVATTMARASYARWGLGAATGLLAVAALGFLVPLAQSGSAPAFLLNGFVYGFLAFQLLGNLLLTRRT